MKNKQENVPDKIYYRIGEVAEITGLQPYILRYWESEFRALSPIKNNAGQRLYKKRDIEILEKIKELLYEKGFTIAGARRQLAALEKEKEEVLARENEVIKNQLSKIEQELKNILTLMDTDDR
jgi:DNA-binding transcriptional MerR regulator